MLEFNLATDSFPVWKALAWVFYPMTVLVAAEMFFNAVDDDDDDDEGGGVMTPVYQEINMTQFLLENAGYMSVFEFIFFLAVGITAGSLGLI